MNNEPVAYETVFDGENHTTKLVEPKLKTLTDEGILEIAGKYWVNRLHYAVYFARAILKKASEK